MPHVSKIKPQQGCWCRRALGQPPLQVLAEVGQCVDSRSRLSWKHLAAMGALPAGSTGVLLVSTGLGHWSMEVPHSPGTHQPAEHLWVLMMEPGTKQENHEAVMGTARNVLCQHTPSLKSLLGPGQCPS